MKMIDAKAEHLDLTKSILRKTLPENVVVFVFGSRVKGTAKPFSDLDLAIDAGRALTLAEIAKLADEFEQSTLPYKIDYVDWHDLSEAFKALINNDCIELSLKEGS